jgi:MFS family permease
MLTTSLVVGLLALSDQLQYWHFYILNFISGTIQAFSVPARHALFANLVPRSAMASAVTLNSIAVRGGGLLGPAIAGLALAYGGYALPFLLNAASFIGMLSALALMRLPRSQTRSREADQSLGRRMAEGVTFAWRTPLLRVTLGLELATGLFGHNSALLTILVRDVLRAGPQELGLIMSAMSGGAMLGMALLVAMPIERPRRLIIRLGAAYALLWTVFGFSSLLWFSTLLAFTLGIIDSVLGVTRNTVAQVLVPDSLRGRVMSVVMLITRGGSQLGRVQSGFVAGLIGAQPAVLLGGGVIAAALLASMRLHLPDKITEPTRVSEREPS